MLTLLGGCITKLELRIRYKKNIAFLKYFSQLTHIPLLSFSCIGQMLRLKMHEISYSFIDYITKLKAIKLSFS